MGIKLWKLLEINYGISLILVILYKSNRFNKLIHDGKLSEIKQKHDYCCLKNWFIPLHKGVSEYVMY